jgi:DNA adenine methylase
MIEPFLKWPGGKRWLANQHASLFPRRFNRYFEPFLGSGAVFFHLKPVRAVLSDANEELVSTYFIVRDEPAKLDRRLQQYQKLHRAEFYYSVRAKCPTRPLERAARFIYLNRVCFNGLYRVNLRGEFNVPLGSKTEVRFPPHYLNRVSALLRSARILKSDFEAVIEDARGGDFLFVDPPYTVAHNNNGFIKYNQVLFSWDDQVRLASAVRRASERGVFIFVANADHRAVIDLYPSFHYCRLNRASILSGKTEARRITSEAAFLNYDPPGLTLARPQISEGALVRREQAIRS